MKGRRREFVQDLVSNKIPWEGLAMGWRPMSCSGTEGPGKLSGVRCRLVCGTCEKAHPRGQQRELP